MVEYIKPEKDRYIKLSQALEVLDSCACWWAHDRMERLPAADVRENVRGEWISPDGISICSNCGKAAPYDVEGDIIMYWPSLNYCPNCGAQMEVQDG